MLIVDWSFPHFMWNFRTLRTFWRGLKRYGDDEADLVDLSFPHFMWNFRFGANMLAGIGAMLDI